MLALVFSRYKNLKTMSELSKKIILDELIENSHIENVEDVIFWALEKYYHQYNMTNGSLVAYLIIQRIKDAEMKGSEDYQNSEMVNTVFPN